MNLDTVGVSIAIQEKNIKDLGRFRWAKDKFPVTDVDRFIFEIERHTNVKLALNYINTDRLGADWHYPTVTLKKKEGHWSVWVEGSLPKFYFGTNMYELTSRDFEPVVVKLYDFLHDNGLFVEKRDIYEAAMYKADVSKILLLQLEAPVIKIMEYLRKMDLDVRHEIHDKEYIDRREGGKGHAVIYGTKKKKLASIYDKLTELRQYTNKSSVEQNIVSFLEEHKDSCYQVLKFEECLHDRKRIKNVCNKITGQKKKYYTFADFWDRDLIKKILLLRGERLFAAEDIKILLLGNYSPSQIQREIKENNPEIRAGRLASIAHWTALANELGMKEMKKQLKANFSSSTQSRTLRQVREFMKTMRTLPLQEVFDDFHNQLQKMKPIESTLDLILPSARATIKRV